MIKTKTTQLRLVVYICCTIKLEELIFSGSLLLNIDILAAILDFHGTQTVIILLTKMFYDEINKKYVIKYQDC